MNRSCLLPKTMKAILLTGHGGLEQLVYRDAVAVPQPSAGEVLIEISACGTNNTDVWVRQGATPDAFDAYLGEIVEGIEALGSELDGLLLHLHGALVTTDGRTDLDFVRVLRSAVGHSRSSRGWICMAILTLS